MFRSKVKEIRHVVNCEICETEMKVKKKKALYVSDCDHKYSFCESCLHHYVIYKVKNFEEVLCPNEDCDKVMDTEASFFKQLPVDIQRNYKKIHQFFITSNDPNLKLCPKEECDGIMRTT